MHSLLKKLNCKNQESVLLINPPASFQATERDWSFDLKVMKDAGEVETSSFMLFFVQTEFEIAEAIAILPKLDAKGLLWFAYPKSTSKHYKSEITRDNGWQPLGNLGYEGVRQVSIDDDWSALRFRHVDQIKTMKRNAKLAMSEKGKKRTE